MSGTTSGTPAVRAGSFVQSIGVNTHMSWQNPGYGYANPGNVEADIAYLGIYHVRDTMPLSWTLGEYQALAATGVKFDLLTTGNGTVDFAGDLAAAATLEASNPGSIQTIEGPNEINNYPIVFDGVSSSNDLSIGVAAQQQLYQMVHADPRFAGVSVLQLTLGVGTPAQYAALAGIGSYADVGNFHIYYANGVAPAAAMAASVAQAEAVTPGAPVDITETGYYTAPASTDWGGVNQDVQAKQTLDALLDAYRDGASTTYIYELMDNIADPASTDREDSFGLFNADGSPKEAAIALHDLTSILGDPAANAQSFTPGSLPYTLGNLPGTGNSLLMETAAGTFDLVVWNEPVLWNEASETENVVATTAVTVNLGATFQTVSVFDPLIGTGPIATYTDVSSLVIGLSDHPLVIQATGRIVAPTGPQTYSLGSAGGTVTSTNADTITTGSGAATVTASANATITGGSGSLSVALTGSGASVTGGSGSLTLTDAQGGNTIVTGSGNNSIAVAAGNDRITADGWTNAITLGAGASTITVFGDAQIVGGSGSAAIIGRGSWINAITGTGSTSVTFLSGAGYVQANGPATINATATAGNISVDAEGPSTSVNGGSGGLYFVGTGNATLTTGSTGTSTFAPTGGNDVFKSYANTTNTFALGAGSDTVYSSGHDTVYGGSGAATVDQQLGSVALLVAGGSGALRLNAGAGNTSLIGGGGAASVVGGTGTLEVQAGSGATTVQFAQGAATVNAGSGRDVFTFGNGLGGGTAVIENFQPGADFLHLSGYRGNQAAQAVAGGVATAAGFTMKLADGTSITIAGMSSFATSYFA